MSPRPKSEDPRPKRYGVTRLWPGYWAVPLALLLSGVTNVAGPLCPCAHAQQPADSASKSWTDSVTAPFKQGFDKLGRALNPKPSASRTTPEDDAISLKGKGKAGPRTVPGRRTRVRAGGQAGGGGTTVSSGLEGVPQRPAGPPELRPTERQPRTIGRGDPDLPARGQGTSAAGVDLQ